MRVADVMKNDIVACRTSDDLAVAAKLMQRHGCGWLPVVDPRGVVVGVLTDRDAFLKAGEANRPIARLAVLDVMSRPAVAVTPSDPLARALDTMAAHRVRRLPVLDAYGLLQGVISIDDVIQVSDRQGAPTAEEVVGALRHIGAARSAGVSHALP